QPIDDLRKCYFVIFFNLQLGTAAMYYNYSAIEEEIEKNKDHPIFAPLYFPSELHRRDALAKNLEYLYGEDWESKISCSAATQPYVDHIHKVGRDDPVLLVAHAWTYYMGDLSRGPVLKKVAQRALKLPPTGEGVNFYHFEGIHNPTAFKRDTKRKKLGLSIITSFYWSKSFKGIIYLKMNKCPYHAARMGEEVVRDTIFLNILFYIMYVENALVVFTLLLPSFSVYHLHM
uniref:Heme oxygenase 2a n=1 Tax=Cyprinus carpio TaxID=7962 RepID=A0A8C1W3M3_CYPCA